VAAPNRAEIVDRDDAFPGRLLGIEEAFDLVDARVVHQHIHWAEPVLRAVERMLDACPAGDVHLDADCPVAERVADLLGASPVHVPHGDGRACLEQRMCDRTTDSPGAASHDGNPISEVRHRSPLSLRLRPK
jgi:hypothetical protein